MGCGATGFMTPVSFYGRENAPTLAARHNLRMHAQASSPKKQSLALVSLVVREYDEAIAFYVGVLGFELIEDTPLADQNKRWVVVAPPGASESRLLLARASGDEQAARIGNQTGGRVFLFLQTDDLDRDYRNYRDKGVVFVRPPKQESYGTVAVFQDLYGNQWDLLQPTRSVQPGVPALNQPTRL